MSNTLLIARRELRSYFNSPIAYIVIVAFLVVAGWMFFSSLFLIGRADMRTFFQPSPFSPAMLFIILAPALTMRLIAEERKSGTIELLTTMPLTDTAVVVGKFLAAIGLIVVALALTMFYPISVWAIGPLDWGPVISGYLGMLLFASSLIGVGLLFSTFTNDQIVSFIVSFLVSFALYYVYWLGFFVPAGLGDAVRWISVSSHLDNMARGVIDPRDVLYYLSVTAGTLILAVYSLSRQHAGTTSTQKNVEATVRLVLVLGILVLANILVLTVGSFGRIDMTRDGQFTLSRASERIVGDLANPVKITGYFTSELPGELEATKRYVKDLLDEYYAASGGTIAYEFIDPAAEETEEDKEKKKEVKRDIFGRAIREATSIEQELRTLGIQEMRIRVNEDDRMEVKRAYMGIAIKSGDKTEVIPSVQGTNNLEYDLTSLIRKITRESAPKLGFVTAGDTSMVQETYGRLYGILGAAYDASTIDLGTTPEIAQENEAVIVVNGPQPFTAAQAKAIDNYIASGRSVAFFLDAVRPDFSTMAAEELQHGLGDLLKKYGVEVQEGLVVDKECATISVSQRIGPLTLPQPVAYPLMPLPKGLDPDHPLTRGLAQVAFPFVSPLKLALPEDSEIQGEVLVRSSPESFLQPPPFDLNPLKRWTAADLEDPGSKAIVISLSGPLSAPAEPPPMIAAETEEGGDDPAVASNARVVVVGGSSLASNQFMSKTNETFLLNLMDWLLLDQDLLAVRSRGLAAAPLGNENEKGEREELSDGVRLTVRWANVLGVPIAFVVFGIIRWRLRESKRARVTL